MAKLKKSSKKKQGSPKEKKNSSPWTEEKLVRIGEFLEKRNKRIEQGQDPKMELFSIQYRMEYYLLTNNAEINKIKPLEEFLQYYLKSLKLPFKYFAECIGTTDANLKKYLGGKRKFNLDLAMKFGSFFHTPPELWLNIQTKNDVLRLQQDKEKSKNYSTYDYVTMLSIDQHLKK